MCSSLPSGSSPSLPKSSQRARRFFGGGSHGAAPAILKGMAMGAPVFLGYIPLGFAYGVLAVKSGISPFWAVAMSVFVYAGAAQFIAASMVASGAPVLSVVLAVCMVNLRHILMCAALSPFVKPFSPLMRTLFALEITDEAFAVHVAAFRKGADSDPFRLFACNLTAHSGWISGSLLGVFSGALVADVRPYGLDFALPAMFLALLVPLCWERLHLAAAMAAALMSLVFHMAGLGRWSVILATVLAAGLGLWLSLKRGDKLEVAAPCESEQEQAVEMPKANAHADAGAPFPDQGRLPIRNASETEGGRS